MVETLPNSAKAALAKALGEVRKEAAFLARCLTVEIDGYGRYDSSAVREATRRYERAMADAAEIGADSLPELRLLIGAEP